MQTQIVPVQVFPGEATRFFLRAGNLGPPPDFYYQLQSISTDKDGNEIVTVLKDGNASMTEEQWAAWPANLGPEGDDNYQLDSICANLGLTRA